MQMFRNQIVMLIGVQLLRPEPDLRMDAAGPGRLLAKQGGVQLAHKKIF